MARMRIKDHDRRPEFSIALAVGAAVLIWFALMLWSSTSAVRAVQRDLGQVSVTYECDDGHRFVSPANTKSLPCNHVGCQRRAWPIWSYQCTKHGAFLCQLRYERDDRQRPRIESARPLGGSWTAVDEAINCPQCERTLLPDITLRLPPQDVESDAPREAAEPQSEDLTHPQSPQE